MKFYNREVEKKELKEIIKDSKYQLCFKVYLWLRRVWKTTLVINTLKESKENFLYLLINWNNTEKIEVKNIKIKIKESLKYDIVWNSLKEIIWNLFKYSEKNHLIIILDEFQNFEYINNSIFWDIVEIIDKYTTWLNETIPKLGLIVLGSYVSLMEKIFSSERALFKRTNRWITKIHPLKFKYIRQICNDYSLDMNQSIELYWLLWGFPYYYKYLIDNKLHCKHVKEVFKKVLLEDLFIETKQTLDIELRWNKYKYSILKAISNWINAKKDILLYTYNIKSSDKNYRVKYNELEKDLNNLIDLWIVYKKIKIPHNNSFKWKYFIKNIFFKNFLKYVSPYESFMEEWNYDYIIKNFYVNFQKDLWFIYEEIIKEYLVSGKYWLVFSQIWKWWKGSNEEIDILWVNELDNFILWVECKYTKDKKWINVLKKLKNRVLLVDWNNKNTKTNYLYLSVSHSWFTKEAIEYAKLNKIDLLETWDLVF